jgi:tripartite-type tricarboxylate transporter receptor subunit TctC
MLRAVELHCRAALFAAALLFASGASAQTYPDRPIRVVVPFSAGSASDVVTRLVLDKMSPALGQQFIVENQPGAGGNIGTATIARAEPSGYNLVMSTSGPLAVNKTLTKNLPYDPEQAFEPISMLATLPNVVVVTKNLPVGSLQELIAYAKARPDELTYSSVGVGSSQHLAGLFFEQLTGTKMRHLPYRVTAQLVTDLITGVVPLAFQNITNVLGQVQSGDLRPLAIASKSRSVTLPDVPTAAEAVKQIARLVYSERELAGARPPERVKPGEWEPWLQSHSRFIPGAGGSPRTFRSSSTICSAQQSFANASLRR